MSSELKNSNEWHRLIYPNHEVIIMDPDGWDRSNFEYSFFIEPITEEQFVDRLMKSTCLRNNTGLD